MLFFEILAVVISAFSQYTFEPDATLLVLLNAPLKCIWNKTNREISFQEWLQLLMITSRPYCEQIHVIFFLHHHAATWRKASYLSKGITLILARLSQVRRHLYLHPALSQPWASHQPIHTRILLCCDKVQFARK